jgi:acid phosphatase family membrane protein YuiD
LWRQLWSTQAEMARWLALQNRSCSMEHPNLKADEYLEKVNHAPYEIIFGLLLGMLCLFTLVILVGIL